MILPRVVQPAIIKIPAFFALRCEGAGIHSKSDVEYARIANATDDPNIPKLNVPRNWADYIHDFFLPGPLCKYSHATIVLSSLGRRNLCSQQSHCIHCSLFCSRIVEHSITTQRIFVQLNLVSPVRAHPRHMGHFEQIRFMKNGVVEWEAQGSLNNEHLMTEQTK